MKFIHAADIHLGAKMDSKFPQHICAMRKEELRNTFKRMVDYARANNVRAIILAGDVFDSDMPPIRDKEFFYSVIRNTPDIDFLYLKGNHDIAAYAEENLPNLKTFNTQWKYYDYGEVVIAGVEISHDNSASIYSTLSLQPDRLNIAVLHGQIDEVSGKDKVNLRRLREKNIDYLALGHIHKLQSGKIDERGEYAYSGCLEGRGFDEIGEHGFLLLETGKKITRKFIPFAERTIIENDVDISGVKDSYSAYLNVKDQIKFEKKNIYRINLVGEIDSEIDITVGDLTAYLSRDCFFTDVKDKTTKKLQWEIFVGDLSLKGEFIRTVYGKAELTEEEKKRIVTIGIKALKGVDIGL